MGDAASCAASRAVEVWPHFSVSRDEFAAWLRQRAEGPGVEALAVSDLYLAFACARGDPSALAAFDSLYFTQLPRILHRFARDHAHIDELAQEIRERLFVARAAGGPRIADYSGRGELKAWFKVIALRCAIDAQRREKRDVSLDEEDGDHEAFAGADPEIAHLRQKHDADFRAAFTDALQVLSSEERLLLRHHYVDRLTIDDLGRLHGIHRVTAARRIQRAREALVQETRRLLRERLRVGDSELKSILGALASQVRITLARVLSGDGADGRG